eukprot:GHVU01047052.1.p1 GENE.GHVU01047052.1~~GHVU01047052.1.p1  ORF type:complete len:145 (+),score=5.97 GHVU01047052.1:577-1011(+)
MTGAGFRVPRTPNCVRHCSLPLRRDFLNSDNRWVPFRIHIRYAIELCGRGKEPSGGSHTTLTAEAAAGAVACHFANSSQLFIWSTLLVTLSVVAMHACRAGCGQHIDSVMGSTPMDKRCGCKAKTQKEFDGGNRKGAGIGCSVM